MEKQKRTRRDKQTIEEEIFRVVEQLVIQKGFNGITFSEIAREAKVERRVLYNRFSGLSGLLDKYVQKYDCWLNNAITFDPNDTPRNNLKQLYSDLVDNLYKNNTMQKVLIWELNDTNKATRRLAQKREVDATDLIEYYCQAAKNQTHGELTNELLAILVAGVYYLILHRKVSTFSFIDFDTPEGKEKLIGVVHKIIDSVYCVCPKKENNNYSIKEVACNFLKNGVDKKIIAASTGLPISEIDKL